MNPGPSALRRLALALLMFTSTVLMVAPASAGEERVYLDVNQPHYADATDLAWDAELVVLGTVVATAAQTEGLMEREVHEVDIIQTLKGQPHGVLEVVQDVGSTDGAVHIQGQHLLSQGPDYVLFLVSDGPHFRTVGGAQGVFVLSRSGWISAAPAREDLDLGTLADAEMTSQAGPTPTPVVTTPPAPSSATASPTTTSPRPTSSLPPETSTSTAIDGPTATLIAPDISEQPDLPAGEDGPGSWLLTLVFFAGLALGAAATAVALARRRPPTQGREHAAPDVARPDGYTTSSGEAVSAQPSAGVPLQDQTASESAAAAVQGLIAVADLTDSPVLLAQVERSLRRAGVEVVTATEGQPFDTAWHHGVGVVPAPSPDLDLSVARVVRSGWRTADGLLRPVEVEVYRSDVP